ncbi:MAG: signal peptidase I, partial [Demequinaceae bacterium]|nr:signal peptidase I [Demequinaceae bacterium]
QLQGSTSMVIVSGRSMEPTYFSGDLVIARKMDPTVGDVIVYAPEGFGGSQIVHRIIGGNAVDGWVMQGDNNPRTDPFTPKASEIRGVVLVHYANFGRVTVLLLNPLVWALVLLAAVVLLVWWSGDTCEDDPKDDDEDKTTAGTDPESEVEEEPDLVDRIVEGTEAAVARMVASAAHAGAAAMAMIARPSASPRHSARAPRLTATSYLRGSAIIAVLGLMAVVSPSTAWASSLGITTSANAFTTAYAPCTTATLGVTNSGTATSGTTYTTISATGLDACAGLKLTYAVYGATGQTLASGSNVTVVTGSNVLTTSAAYDAALVKSVLISVNGWPLTNTWTYTPPANLPTISCLPVNNGGNVVSGNGQSCTVAVTSVSSWTSYPGAWGVGTPYYHYSLAFDVTSTMNQWQITVDFSDTSTFPLYNAVPVYVGSGYNIVNAPGYSCSALPTYQGRKAAGNVSTQNNAVMYVTSAPGSTNGTTRLCP